MKYDDFMARVRDRGEYTSREEAEQVTSAVLEVLASRMTAEQSQHLAAQLPNPLDEDVEESGAGPGQSFGVEEFCRRIAELTGARPRTAQWDAGAVLSTLAEAVSGGEVNHILSQLPSGYAELFGKAELS